ncbi:NUDIX domain-containing protein [Streptomyces sp. JJ38]|uniref:NUDIX domain-containing protein n=1 Tax=Streptomyces sp. JJ38 TaxID=2738128 RepID=UPI001C570BCC|nr:NUDIX hydrolase [Streptomyces sp. JJ38]MBW1599432.1 NUDIX hydrolase [Streptomyces sp. JJ38]
MTHEDVPDGWPVRITMTTTPTLLSRTAGLALIRDLGQRVLMREVPGLQSSAPYELPGGPAEAGESALDACRRHLADQTGRLVQPSALLLAHHIPLTGAETARHDFLFDCGQLQPDERWEPDAAGRWRWILLDDLRDLVEPVTEWRINLALDAVEGEPARYLTGVPDFPALSQA